MSSHRLLIPEPPLQVLPQLAARIGLNEAIVLQQLHYWTQVMGSEWIFNTIDAWQEQFPFWSTATVKRTLKSLREQGLIEVEQRGRGSDRTNSYRVLLDAIPSDQSDPMGVSSCADDRINLIPSLTYTESTTETTSRQGEVEEIFSDWVDRFDKRRAKLTPERRKVIQARLAEGYTKEEIKQAILGCSRSPFHRGENPNGNRYEDLTLICQSGSKLEGFRDRIVGKSRGKGWDGFIEEETAGASV